MIKSSTSSLLTKREIFQQPGQKHDKLQVPSVYAQVDISVLELIQCILGNRGLAILSHLLRQAYIQQLPLPDIGIVPVAIIHSANTYTLAKATGCGKDTLLRHIAIYRAFGLMLQSREQQQTVLSFPLIPYQHTPETICTALQRLESGRPKLRQLAQSVRDRYLLAYTTSEQETLHLTEAIAKPADISRETALLENPDVTTLSRLLNDIQQVLQAKRTTAIKRQLLQRQIAAILTYLQSPSLSTVSVQGDQALSTNQSWLLQQQKQKQRDQPSRKDLSLPEYSTQEGDQIIVTRAREDQIPQKGDQGIQQKDQDAWRKATSRTYKGDLLQQEGDQVRQYPSTKGDRPQQEGDRVEPKMFVVSHDRSDEGDQQDTLRSEQAQQGDQQQQEGDQTALTLNDNSNNNLYNNFKKNTIVNVNGEGLSDQEDRYTPKEARTIGQELASFLENSPENTGGFVNKAKQCTRTVIRAAVIDVLVHQSFPTVDPADERGRPLNKARWFHGACNAYSLPGAQIPAYVTRWLLTDLSWREIDQQLQESAARYAPSMVAGGLTADLVRQWLRGEMTQAMLEESLAATGGSKRPLQCLNAPVQDNSKVSGSVATSGEMLPDKAWMNEDEAEVLAQEILRDGGPLGMISAIPQWENGVFVVSLTCRGTLWRKTPMCIRSPQQWRTNFEELKNNNYFHK